MKIRFQIPKSITDVPLSDYQEFARLQSQYKDKDADEYMAMRMVALFGNVPVEQLRKIGLDKYEVAIQEINKLFEQTPTFRQVIKISGHEFGFIPNLEDITLGEYVDIDNYIKDPKDWHKLLAVLYRPITMKVRDTYRIEEYETSEKYSGLMRFASFADAYASVLFFWTLIDELLAATMTYSMEGSKTTTKANGKDSQSDGAGISRSTISQARTLLESTVLHGFHFTPVYKN